MKDAVIFKVADEHHQKPVELLLQTALQCHAAIYLGDGNQRRDSDGAERDEGAGSMLQSMKRKPFERHGSNIWLQIPKPIDFCDFVIQ